MWAMMPMMRIVLRSWSAAAMAVRLSGSHVAKMGTGTSKRGASPHFVAGSTLLKIRYNLAIVPRRKQLPDLQLDSRHQRPDAAVTERYVGNSATILAS